MAEQQQGLRFDIYERVHLQEGLAGIQELNDVELIPHIHVLTLDDQAILKGNLLLAGTYFSDEGKESRTLEHLIPVEITLPLNRIHRVEDILVDIENFDIDLLSARSLNVTGILSLQGVEMISAPLESWQGEEEVTFVHETELSRTESEPTAVQPAHEPVQPEPTLNVESSLQSAPEPAYSEPVTEQPVMTIQEPPPDDNETVAVELEPPQPESTIVTAEKKELKVAFGKKASEAVDISPYGMKSFFSKASSYLQDKKREEEQAALEEEAKIDVIEWRRLFLQSNSSSQEFSKLRMCIVQKQETLDSIARRYHLHPRELQLLNRLNDQEVTAGQVIYLPLT